MRPWTKRQTLSCYVRATTNMQNMLRKHSKLLDGRAEFVVAGNPACTDDLKAAGIMNFIHVRSNVLETLQAFNSKLLK